MNPLELMSGHEYVAYFTAAGAGICSAVIASLNVYTTRRASRQTALRVELEKIRDHLMSDITLVLNAQAVDPWAVLTGERERSSSCLRDLIRAANADASPTSWHKFLDGHDYDCIQRFLVASRPLVLVLRRTPLQIVGAPRCYNGDKPNTARAIFKAMNIRMCKGA